MSVPKSIVLSAGTFAIVVGLFLQDGRIHRAIADENSASAVYVQDSEFVAQYGEVSKFTKAKDSLKRFFRHYFSYHSKYEPFPPYCIYNYGYSATNWRRIPPQEFSTPAEVPPTPTEAYGLDSPRSDSAISAEAEQRQAESSVEGAWNAARHQPTPERSSVIWILNSSLDDPRDVRPLRAFSPQATCVYPPAPTQRPMLTVWNGQVCVAGELPHPDCRYKLIAYWPTGITSQQWQATRNSGALNQPLNGDGNGCYTERTTGVQVRLADGDATTVVHASVVENPASRLAGSDRIDAVIAPMNRGTTSPLPERVPRVSPQAATKGNSE